MSERRLPETLTAGGNTRQITAHLQARAAIRSHITPERLAYALNNWVIRGVRYDEYERPSIAYLGWVEHNGGRHLMRVAVTMDDQRIITAFLDTSATEKFNSGDMAHFQRYYESLELRDETASEL